MGSFYVEQVRTASDGFCVRPVFLDVVGTWSGVTGVQKASCSTCLLARCSVLQIRECFREFNFFVVSLLSFSFKTHVVTPH